MKFDLKFSWETIGPDLGSGLTVALISIPVGQGHISKTIASMPVAMVSIF